MQKKAPQLFFLFLICFLSTMLGGTVSTLMSVYLPVAASDLLGALPATELDRISAYINAVFIFGWAFGGFTWGYIGDVIGRKKSLLLSVACYGAFTMLTGYMDHWSGVVMCRILSGFGVGGVMVTSVTLMSEVWPEKTKSIAIGILSIAFPIGIFSAGVIDFIVSSWREGFMVGVIPVTFALIGIWALRESDKWLLSRNEGLHKNGALQLMFSGLHSKNIISGSIIFGTMLIGLWAVFSWLPTWVQSLIHSGDAHKERGLSMMLMGMGGLSGGFFSGWFIKMAGLKRSLSICFAGCALMSVILFKTNVAFSSIIYVEIGLLAIFFGASQGILSTYIPLLFPFAMRNTATGFCFNIGRLFTATAVLFVGLLVETLGGYGNSLTIFSAVFLLGWIAVWFVKPVHITTH